MDMSTTTVTKKTAPKKFVIKKVVVHIEVAAEITFDFLPHPYDEDDPYDEYEMFDSPEYVEKKEALIQRLRDMGCFTDITCVAEDEDDGY